MKGRLAASVFLILLLGLGACARPISKIRPSGPVLAGKLQARALTEASGLASSRSRPGVLWSLNDSGGRPILYAFDERGGELGQVTLPGTENVDWEDLAAFSWQGENWLLVADTGDNREHRSHAALHLLREPEPDSRGRYSGQAGSVRSLSFTYPAGPRDCEAVAVDEAAGQILLLSKRTEPPVLYQLPLTPPEGDQPAVALPVAPLTTIPPPQAFDLLLPYGRSRSQPTAMDLAPDGRTLLVLTYRHAYLFRREEGESWAAALARNPQKIELPGLFDLPQREAACFSADGRSLFVTSEGEGAAIYRVEIPRRPGPENFRVGMDMSPARCR